MKLSEVMAALEVSFNRTLLKNQYGIIAFGQVLNAWQTGNTHAQINFCTREEYHTLRQWLKEEGFTFRVETKDGFSGVFFVGIVS